VYTTQQLIQDELGGLNKLTEALDDTGSGLLDPNLITRILQRASDTVDSFLSGRYLVPLSPVPKLAVEASTIFACEIIFNRRRQALEQVNPYSARAKEFVAMLKAISDRKQSLDATERPAFQPGAVIHRPSAMEGSSL